MTGDEAAEIRTTFVVAMTPDGVIGRDGGIPWRLPRDLKHFKALTWGRPIIMGRKTHESLGRPLPGRTNIVLTRQTGYRAEGCVVVGSVEEALAESRDAGPGDTFVIGGGEVYRAFLPTCDTIHLTMVEAEVEGDVAFPLDPLLDPTWRVVREEHWPADEQNELDAYYFVIARAGSA